MKLRYYQVDSFSAEAFGGNPAAVFFLDEFISDQLMLNIANEMNLSETAFVVRNKSNFDIRFFTPTHEAKLCGHATLAASHLVYELNMNEQANFEFNTTVDVLKIRKEEGRVSMELPLYPLEEVEPMNEQIALLGFKPLAMYKSAYNWVLAVAPDEHYVKNFVPNVQSMLVYGLGHLMVTAKSPTPEVDFVSRCFAPEMGILEDPVTGSSMCALAPYWSRILHKDNLISKQLSARGGVLYTQLQKNSIIVSGDAVTVIQAELEIKS